MSSSSIISAASLATSVPVMPIATPISASFKAGLSFTPSPVIAATSPVRFNDLIMRSLSEGETRANTTHVLTASSSCSSVISSSSEPVITVLPLRNMWSCFAIASAVTLWSPVIIITRMPASWHVSTAPITSFLGGSIIPTAPMKVIPYSMLSVSFSGTFVSCLLAKPRTRSALLDILLHKSSILRLSTSVISRTPPLVKKCVHSGSISSTAPLV